MVIELSVLDLALAALLILALAGLSLRLGLGMEQRLLMSAARTTIQLLLIGLVLKLLFDNVHFLWVAAMAAVMITAAGREVMARQKRRFTGGWGFGLGTLSMFVSSFTVTVIALVAVIGTTPWYAPQYAIPLLGMVLGNTMNGIALGLDRLTQDAAARRSVLEARLALGQDWRRNNRRQPPRSDAGRHDPDHQRHVRCRYRQPAGDDDRPDPGRYTAGGSGQIPDSGDVPDRRRHRFRHRGGGESGRAPALR
jgi:uncharacterized protein (TIGR00245 family)